MAERSVLTKEQVEAAESREGIEHPALIILEKFEDRLIELRAEVKSIQNNQEQQKYIAQTHGFLADELEEVREFSVELPDLLAVWSKATEVFGVYQRYAFSQILSTSYALQGEEGAKHKDATRFILENGTLPKTLSDDKVALNMMQARFDEISRSLKEINLYVYGTEESGLTQSFELAKKLPDEEAVRKLKELGDRHDALMTQTMAQLLENFGNGMVPVRLDISRALGEW